MPGYCRCLARSITKEWFYSNTRLTHGAGNDLLVALHDDYGPGVGAGCYVTGVCSTSTLQIDHY